MADEPQPAPANAGDDLLSAFLGSVDQSEANSKQFERPAQSAEGADQPDEVEASEGEDIDEGEADAPESEDEPAEVEADEPDGDYVEHEGKKLAVSELLAAYQFKSSHEKSLDQLRTNAINEGNREIETRRNEYLKRNEALDSAYEFLQSLIPEYERPAASMLDRNSRDYDPDTYHYLNRQIDEIEGRKRGAAQQVQQARQFREQEQQTLRAQAIKDNAAKLAAADPTWADPKTAQSKAAELTKALKDNYGFDDATIASVLDHRFFLLAQDAAAYRASLAKGAPKPKGENKAAPKLIRSKAKPQATAPASKRKADAERALKKTGKVTDLEAIFGDFV